MIESLVMLWVGLFILDLAFTLAVGYGVLVMAEFDRQKESEWTYVPLQSLLTE